MPPMPPLLPSPFPPREKSVLWRNGPWTAPAWSGKNITVAGPLAYLLSLQREPNSKLTRWTECKLGDTSFLLDILQQKVWDYEHLHRFIGGPVLLITLKEWESVAIKDVTTQLLAGRPTSASNYVLDQHPLIVSFQQHLYLLVGIWTNDWESYIVRLKFFNQDEHTTFACTCEKVIQYDNEGWFSQGKSFEIKQVVNGPWFQSLNKVQTSTGLGIVDLRNEPEERLQLLHNFLVHFADGTWEVLPADAVTPVTLTHFADGTWEVLPADAVTPDTTELNDHLDNFNDWYKSEEICMKMNVHKVADNKLMEYVAQNTNVFLIDQELILIDSSSNEFGNDTITTQSCIVIDKTGDSSKTQFSPDYYILLMHGYNESRVDALTRVGFRVVCLNENGSNIYEGSTTNEGEWVELKLQTEDNVLLTGTIGKD